MGSAFVERRKAVRIVAPRLLRLRDVLAISGLSRATLYRQMHEGGFPHPVKIGSRASAWVKQEVEAWIAQRIRQRDQAAALH